MGDFLSHFNDDEEWVNTRSELFDYFRKPEYHCEPVDVISLEMVFDEHRRRQKDLEDAKFRLSGNNSGPPLCDLCSLKHPPLTKNQYQIEEEKE